MNQLYKPGGCLDQYKDCQKLEAELDPQGFGNVEEVNQVCDTSSKYCGENDSVDLFVKSGRGVYDIAHPVCSLLTYSE